ncbi:alpha/beta hydrolase [Bifidobacterium cuniculi]|uniref:Putative alpha/beta hydrolase fold protein n=1 Tax=Bifidobacterium cuniculi TaxID=1688 RepID=A0A087B423_9BIFI|nr:alpha/beta hydrolase [Bifidobacterium cuniculi]KFI65773.1 putative alpha/beta hydrolase fold protein [Bifidobacterium cuniculi]
MTDTIATNPYPLIRHGDDPHGDIAAIARYWTPVDDGLDRVDDERARTIRDYRLGVASFDFPRTDYWHDPAGVDAITDLAYLPDAGYGPGQVRGHLLDLYLPHDAILRGGATMPVFIDIHGGGFAYGAKELNRNFCTHLAASGLAVFSINYRLAPETDLSGQLADVQAALAWIDAHLGDWPVSRTNIFLTGDSAGGALAWLTALAEADTDAAAAFGLQRVSGLPFKGMALISPAVNFSRKTTPCAPSGREGIVATLGGGFLPAVPEADRFLSPATALAHLHDVVPVFLSTSSDDFIESQSLQLATALSSKGADFELDDVKVAPTSTLGHVFPVCLTWLEESRRVLQLIHDFAMARCR